MVNAERLSCRAVVARGKSDISENNPYSWISIIFSTELTFRRHIPGVPNNSDILIEVIGRMWVGPSRRGIKRIKEDTDHVCIGIETAMQKGIRVIPVLVEGATMPKANDVPESLNALIKSPFGSPRSVGMG